MRLRRSPGLGNILGHAHHPLSVEHACYNRSSRSCDTAWLSMTDRGRPTMVMIDTAVLGRITWHELLTTDVKAAEKFYTAVIGWGAKPFEGSPQSYDLWTRSGDVPVGGVMKIPQGMNFPPHWGMYVGVPKLEDAVARIERLGGSALSPVIEVPDVGR